MGTVVYTLIEYWFHRFVLHELLSRIHNNHHREPRKLKIITTPIIPAIVYDLLIILILNLVFGQKTASGLNGGIAIGQIMMELTHVLHHSRNTHWLLRYARSYHLWHHFGVTKDCETSKLMSSVDTHKKLESSHGLTTPFWDFVFRTQPTSWPVYRRYPFLRFVLLPFPLVSFVLMAIVIRALTLPISSPAKEETSSPPKSEWQDSLSAFGKLEFGYFLSSCVGGMSTVFFLW